MGPNLPTLGKDALLHFELVGSARAIRCACRGFGFISMHMPALVIDGPSIGLLTGVSAHCVNGRPAHGPFSCVRNRFRYHTPANAWRDRHNTPQAVSHGSLNASIPVQMRGRRQGRRTRHL